MKITTVAAGVGAIWLAILSDPAQAYLIDWNQPYNTMPIQGFSLGTTEYSRLMPYQFDVGWNRSIQMWQAVDVEAQARGRVVNGIQLYMISATGSGNVDLNVYEGVGPNGRLVSSTKLYWLTSSGRQWFGFKLDTPVKLTASAYTFSFENLLLSPDGGIGFSVREKGVPLENPFYYPLPFDQPFHQYCFASHPKGTAGGNEAEPFKRGSGRDVGWRGYLAGTKGCRINYFFLE